MTSQRDKNAMHNILLVIGCLIAAAYLLAGCYETVAQKSAREETEKRVQRLELEAARARSAH